MSAARNFFSERALAAQELEGIMRGCTLHHHGCGWMDDALDVVDILQNPSKTMFFAADTLVWRSCEAQSDFEGLQYTPAACSGRQQVWLSDGQHSAVVEIELDEFGRHGPTGEDQIFKIPSFPWWWSFDTGPLDPWRPCTARFLSPQALADKFSVNVLLNSRGINFGPIRSLIERFVGQQHRLTFKFKVKRGWLFPGPTPTLSSDRGSFYAEALPLHATISKTARDSRSYQVLATCGGKGGVEVRRISARYSSFATLNARLGELWPELVAWLPPFPPKLWLHIEIFLEERRRSLEHWLNWLIAVLKERPIETVVVETLCFFNIPRPLQSLEDGLDT